MTVSAWVLTHRRRLGLPQWRLAMKLGTTERTVQRWEAGASPLLFCGRLERLFRESMPPLLQQRYHRGESWHAARAKP